MSTTITPGVVAVVLIAQLGSPQYRERAQASRALYQMTPLSIPYLEAARQHHDREISERSSRILSSYYESIADHMAERMRPTGWPRLPWLDQLPQDYPDRKAVIGLYLRKAQSTVGRKGPPDWSDYRMATKLYLRELFLDQQRPEKVRQLLNRMANSEREWIIQNGKKYTPPLKVPPVP